MYVLGIAASNHDRAAALLRNGRIVCAVAEERLDRRKRSPAYLPNQYDHHTVPPLRAITAVMREAGVGLDDLDLVVCGRSLHAYRDALLEFLPLDADRVVEPAVPGHHIAHAYSAFATSPFDSAGVLVLDEQGHWVDGRYESASWFRGRESGVVEAVTAFTGDHRTLSLGMFYSVISALTRLSEAGFPAAGKLMGLAATGKSPQDWPSVVRLDRGAPYVDLQDLDHLLHHAGLRHTVGRDDVRLCSVADLTKRYRPLRWNTERARSLAAYAQAELERGVMATAVAMRAAVDEPFLCLAGGVTLNGPSVTKLQRAGWRDVFVHPAATDDGIAIGLAYYGHVEILHGGRERNPGGFNPYTGPTYRSSALPEALGRFGLAEVASRHPTNLIAADIADGAAVGWFHGRSEWGPRALGGRSILTNLGPGVADRINSQIKHREPFRPVGISVTAQALERLGLEDHTPPGLAAYMIAVVPAEHAVLRHVRHTDGSVRVHVVSPGHNPAFHELLEEVGRLTGTEAVVNTSFNGFGEPLVETPADAVRQFLAMDIDSLYLDGYFVRKADLNAALLTAARTQAVTATSANAFNYAQSLAEKGLHEQARDHLAATRTPGSTVLTGPQTVLAASLALQAGQIGVARALCHRFLARREDELLSALATVLVRCGDHQAGMALARLAEAGGVRDVLSRE